MLTQEQLDLRKKGIGGSEIAALLGLDKYTSPLQIWKNKLGIDEPFEGNKYTRAGNKLEPVIKEYFTEETGFGLQGDNSTHQDGFKISTPDDIYFEKKPKDIIEGFEVGILECKATLKYLEEPEDSWVCQGNWYAGNLGLKKIAIAWLERGVDFKYRILDFNQDLYEHMVKVAERFWNDYILKQVPPPAMTEADVNYLYPKHEIGKTIEARQEVYNDYLQLLQLKKQSKELNEQIENLELNLKLCFFDAENLIYGGETIATYKSPKPTIKFDTERLKAENPAIYSQYLDERQNSRRLHLR